MKTLLVLVSVLGLLIGSSSAQEVFRLRFAVYDLDRNDPAKTAFQINTLDTATPSTFLRIGEIIPRTTLKLVRFESKIERDEQGTEKDVSELTVRHTVTG